MKQGIFDWCSLVWDWIVLSLLHIATVVFSVGLLGATASVAVYRVCFKKIAAKDTNLFKDYFSALRENLKSTLLLNAVFAVAVYLCWFYIKNGFSEQLLAFFVSRNLFLFLVAVLFVFSGILYLVPILAYFNTVFSKAVVCAFALSMNYLLVTVLLYLCLIGFFVLVQLTAGFAALFFVGGYSYVSARILKNVFDRHQQEGETT